MITDERAEDLAIFHNKIYRQFQRKGLNNFESADILAIMICKICKYSEFSKSTFMQIMENHWDTWDDLTNVESDN